MITLEKFLSIKQKLESSETVTQEEFNQFYQYVNTHGPLVYDVNGERLGNLFLGGGEKNEKYDK